MFNLDTVIIYDPTRFESTDAGALESELVEQKLLISNLLRVSLFSGFTEPGRSQHSSQMVNNAYRLANDLQEELAHFINIADKLDRISMRRDLPEIEMRTKAMFEKYGNKAYPYERVTELSIENTELRKQLELKVRFIERLKQTLGCQLDEDDSRLFFEIGKLQGKELACGLIHESP